MKINIMPQKPFFYLNFAAGLSVTTTFHDCSLFIQRSKITTPIVDAHRRALTISPAKYPLTRIEVKQVIVPTGLLDVWIDNLVYGKLPRRLFVFFIDNEAFNGHQEKDPFEFKHYDLNYIACFVDGTQ